MAEIEIHEDPDRVGVWNYRVAGQGEWPADVAGYIVNSGLAPYGPEWESARCADGYDLSRRTIDPMAREAYREWLAKRA